jgi:hypothetical protein
MKMEKERRWGAAIFEGEEEEEARQGGSTVLEADNIAKSGTTAGEAEGGGWRM